MERRFVDQVASNGNWIMDFLNGMTIPVKIGSVIKKKNMVENGGPRGVL